MKLPPNIKEEAIKLRKKGYSIKEITELLNIAQSTSSIWLSGIPLNSDALKRLEERRKIGRANALNTRSLNKQIIKENLLKHATAEISKIRFSKGHYKLLCSLLFWTEGGKFTDSYAYFMNSDPNLIELFMKLIRLSFDLDEKKFRAMVHIHNYHNNDEVIKYWSAITNIPKLQFSKSYLKQNTEKRIRDGYMGCLRIRYYDYRIALELRAYYNALVLLI